jgi:hypothetical protein
MKLLIGKINIIEYIINNSSCSQFSIPFPVAAQDFPMGQVLRLSFVQRLSESSKNRENRHFFS